MYSIIRFVSEWNNEINALISGKRNIYIYGTGFCGKFCADYIKNCGGNICAFVETWPQKKMVDDIRVISVGEMHNETIDSHNSVCIVAVQKKYTDSIEQILRGFDYRNYYTVDFNALADDTLNSENEEFWENNTIYNLLVDEESRTTFKYVCAARLSVNMSYYPQMHCNSHITVEAIDNKGLGYLGFDEWIKQGTYKEEGIIAYFPYRFWLDFSIPRLLEIGINVTALCTDNENYWHKVFRGKYVLPLEEVKKIFPGKKIFVATSISLFKSSIEKILKDNNIPAEDILIPCQQKNPYTLGLQYFDFAGIRFGKNEVYVDVGIYDGLTTMDFIKKTGSKYSHIYAFEPDSNNYKVCTEFFEKEKVNDISVINKGLWSKCGQLSFSNDGTPLSKIDSEGELTIDVTTLDMEVPDGCTYIKMDIEGAEYEALLGAENVIKKYKPKLAISIYHKSLDFIDIPMLIHKMVPEYKFDLRHYSVYKFETILYAYI